MGTFNKELNMTVCDKFTPTVLDGRLCYKVDINKLVGKEGVKTGPEQSCLHRADELHFLYCWKMCETMYSTCLIESQKVLSLQCLLSLL